LQKAGPRRSGLFVGFNRWLVDNWADLRENNDPMQGRVLFFTGRGSPLRWQADGWPEVDLKPAHSAE
jgi:hypothetical protein